jgi:protein phosphatase
MGTTLVACLVDNAGVRIRSVGDSRAYLISPDGAIQLTTDHSVASEQVRAGLITKAAAEHSPQRNVLTRCLGTERRPPEIDSFGPLSFPLRRRVLLCSDGLYDAVSAADISALAGASPVEDATRLLVQEAIDRGSRDNVSAVLIAHADA